MNIDIKDLLNNSFVISINSGRYQFFQKIFQKNQLVPFPKLYEGYKLKKIANFQTLEPYQNCSISHLSLVKIAKLLDLPFICIFEDDAYPCFNVYEKLQEYLMGIPNDSECLSLGFISRKTSGSIVNKKFYRTTSNVGSQSYIVFKNAYEKYIDNMYTMNNKNGSDGIITTLNLYSTEENLFIQYNSKNNQVISLPGYSLQDNRDHIFDNFPKAETYL